MTTRTKTKTKNHADVLSRLDAIARNLWWSWQPDAQRLFASLDPRLWEATHHNPIKTIRLLAPERREMLGEDPGFLAHLQRIEKSLKQYLTARTWFARSGKALGNPLVAYFCFEFAI